MSKETKEGKEEKVYLGLNRFNWIILTCSLTLFSSGLIPLIGSLITIAQGYREAIMITIVNSDVTSVTFCASVVTVVTSILGMLAVYRKDRRLLACHTLCLWPSLALLTTVGYIAYRDTVWDLKTVLGMKWRYDFSANQHFQLQQTLSCCGFENSSDHAVYESASRCTAESLLQGCHEKLYKFEAYFLTRVYSVCFGLIPLYIIIIFLCYYSQLYVGRK